MKIRMQIATFVLLTVGVTAEVLADCTGGSTVERVQAAYAEGQAHERAGRLKDALSSFLGAQAYICDAKNPVALAATKRAAQVAKPLGASKEKEGNFEEAFVAYESGGLYADADRVMIANARAHAEDPNQLQVALSHFYERERKLTPYTVRLSVTGPYTAVPNIETDLLALADKAVERALEREAAAFNEAYLRERMQIIQARPEDRADFQAMDAELQREIGFQKKWPEDLMKTSRDELSKVLALSRVIRAPDVDAGRHDRIAARAYKRSEERAETLTQRYSGAPQFLEDAVEYRQMFSSQHPTGEPGIQRVRAQAMKLGDEANAKGRYGLAHDYYSAADDRDKAMAARKRQNELAQKKLQPKIDEMTRQAEALKAGFGSPADIAAMQKQAQEAQKAMQQQKPDKKERAKKADDLESELGL